MKDYSANPEKAICLDVETTNKDPNTAEILQLSIIDYNGDVLFNEYIKPDKAMLWPEAEIIHHISPFQVMEKPHLNFYYDKLKNIFEKAELIITYNGDHYDIPIIVKYGFPELRDKLSYDVMLEFAPIYGAWDDYHGSYTWQKLSVCADYYGYENSGASFHNSLEDARATLYCYKMMVYRTEQVMADSNIQQNQLDFSELAMNVYRIIDSATNAYRRYSNFDHWTLEQTAKNIIEDRLDLYRYGFIFACDILEMNNLKNKNNIELLKNAFETEWPNTETDWDDLSENIASAWRDVKLGEFGPAGPMRFYDFWEFYYNEIRKEVEDFFNKNNYALYARL